jgi:hypothetical protein
MMKETFALINDKDQVVNHIVIDKDDANFEVNMAGQLTHWACVRYVETTEEQPVIILDESPTIWTTHTEETGFVIPEEYLPPVVEPTPLVILPDHETVVINGKTYPKDSLLIKENASLRPEGWVLPEDAVEVTLADKE